MRLRYLLLFVCIGLGISSCKKPNEVSNIPQISLLYFVAGDGTDSVLVNKDTAFLKFSITDGDADLGNDPSGSQGDIYIKDMRSGDFAPYFFPSEIQGVEDPSKGIKGTCEFIFPPELLIPRSDTPAHSKRDTTSFEFYVIDRAGHQSNHLTTGRIIMYQR